MLVLTGNPNLPIIYQMGIRYGWSEGVTFLWLTSASADVENGESTDSVEKFGISG